jgi:hypothetical protein
MFIETKKVTTQYTRSSKLKKSHAYSRVQTIAVFQCDCCESLFERALGKMDYRRLSDNYFHVCANCNPKQFAQQKGVERRLIWNMPVDSDLKI